MARSVLVSALITRIRQAADIENDGHITDSEILGLINSYYPWFYDILVENAPPDYFNTAVTFTTVANTESYSIASTVAPLGDFYKIRGLYVMDNDGRKRPIRPVQNNELFMYRAPTQSGVTIYLEYIPACPVISSDQDPVDGVNGWEELIVQRCAAVCRRKRDEDESPHLRECAELEARIRKMDSRDDGEPSRVVRRRYIETYPYTNNTYDIRGYRLVGENLKIYSRPYYWYL